MPSSEKRAVVAALCFQCLLFGLFHCLLAGLYAQQTPPSATVAPVPRLMRIASAFRPVNGPPARVESVTFSIYKDDRDPAPLWQETQNVALDAEGRYTVLMGASLAEGMPLELFSAGEPRWLGVQFNRPGEIEQPRVLLVSVPYALRAADADTLGGKPASAYMLSPPETARGEKGDTSTSQTSASTSTRGKKLSAGPDSVNSLSGSFNEVDVQFNDTSGTLTGYSVQNLGSGAASYSGMLFYDQNGALGQFQGFNNSTHEYRINNIASGGSINFMIGSSSKFLVANSGNVGIGTATPGSKLDVAGTAAATTLSLPATTAGGSGVLTIGGSRFLHNFANNTFLGTNAGNFTVVGTGSVSNTGVGNSALASNTSGAFNTATGTSALLNNTTGSANTANGANALRSNTTGSSNTATGSGALFNNTTGGSNTANGAGALNNNTTGNENTATGAAALASNTTGGINTATGELALFNNTTGSYNTATGQGTLYSNTTGNDNTATGASALSHNTTGSDNTSVGAAALGNNTTGSSNTAVGFNALLANTVGNNNTALGYLAGSGNTAGSNNTFIGYQAGPLLSGTGGLTNATAIGANALVSADNTVVLGGSTVSVAIGTAAAATKLQVVGDIRVGTSGTNGCVQGFDGTALAGTCSSDARLKQNIEPFAPVLDKLTQLRPVSYEWKADEHPEYHFGPGRTVGLIAQEVERLFPEMVAVDERGYKAVNYSQIPLLLLQAVRELKTENDRLRKELDAIKNGFRIPSLGSVGVGGSAAPAARRQ